MDDLRRAITDDTLPRGAEFDEEDEAEDEDDMDGAESRMRCAFLAASFCFPTPLSAIADTPFHAL